MTLLRHRHEKINMENENKKEVKIYQMDEFCSVIAYDEKSAIKFYIDEMKVIDDAADMEKGFPYQIEGEGLKGIVTEIDEPGHPQSTYAELLESAIKNNHTIPGFFVCSE